MKLISVLLISTLLITGFNLIDNKGDSKTTLGRYVEEVIPMPKAVQKGDEHVTDLVKTSNGGIELYTTPDFESNVQYTLNKDFTWKRTIPEWLNKIKSTIQEIEYAPDGTKLALVVFYENSNLKFQLLRSTDNKTSSDVTLNYIKKPDTLYIEPCGFQILNDNSIILETYDDYCTLYKKGKAFSTFRIFNNQYALSDNYVITMNDNGYGYNIKDINTSKNIYTLPVKTQIKSASFATDSKGNFYIIDMNGIQRMAIDGKEGKTLLEGNMATMSNPTRLISTIITGKADDLFVLYHDEQLTSVLMHYVVNKNIPTKPAHILSATSLFENSTLRQAMIDFNQKHQDVQVTYSPMILWDNRNFSEVINSIKSFKKKALTSNDLIVLDDLPRNSYIDKKDLTDISTIINTLVDNGTLLKNIISNYKTDTNSIYTIPIRYQLPFAFGDKKAVNSTKSITTLADYTKNADLPLFGSDLFTCGDVLRILLESYYNEFITNNDIDRDGLINFLKQLKIICDQTISDVSQEELSNDLFYTFSSNIKSKEALLGCCNLSSIKKAYDPISTIEEIKGDYTSVNNQFIPQCQVGINNKSKQKELAFEFIKFLLDDSFQSRDIGDGFPVNSKSLIDYGIGDNSLVYDFSDITNTQYKKKLSGIYDLCKIVKTPITFDNVIFNIILSDTTISYLRGEATLKNTADKLMEEVNSYYAD
jgi:hypothetical protein